MRRAQRRSCAVDVRSRRIGRAPHGPQLALATVWEDDGMRIGAFVLGMAFVASACGRGHGPFAHGNPGARPRALAHVDQALDGVGASDAQKARARAIVGRTLTEIEPWRPAVGRLRTELVAAWRTDAPDRAALHRRVDEEADALRALGHALVEDGLELHGVLTSAQRDALVRHVGHDRLVRE
jgi:hypothetical protein